MQCSHSGPEEIARVIADVLAPGHFCTRDLILDFQAAADEDIAWEIFRGRLLDPAQTRQRRRFRAWNVAQLDGDQRSPEPLLSVKLDEPAGALHVVRALPCHVWEAYDAGDNVILSRETVKWVRELVGTIVLVEFSSPDDLRAELAGRLWQAVIGTSRLPLTSVEAPLPAFTLGQLAYVYRSGGSDATRPMQSWQDLLTLGLNADLSLRETAKLLEFLLRTVSEAELAEATRGFIERWQSLGRAPRDVPVLWRTMFNDVALSPYTDFVDKSLSFLQVLVDRGDLTAEEQVDALGALLRQLGRHLTAYDLITFHHRGANYPDALLLDAALKQYLRLAERRVDLFEQGMPGRLRRRALRQACVLRHAYDGHAVPDAPTSPGENARVLPPPHVRVPEEQILQPATRRRRLYAGDPLGAHLGAAGRRLLQQSCADLAHADELRELGMAVFIERPLGVGKPPGAPDQTPLLAHEAFSRSLAARRLSDLTRLARDVSLDFDGARHARVLANLVVAGLALSEVSAPERNIVSLADARRVADDFVLLRTLPGSVHDLLAVFPLADVAQRHGVPILPPARALIVRVAGGSADLLAICDALGRKRLEFEVDVSAGFRARGGVEFPAAGLRLVRVRQENGDTLVVSESIAPSRDLPHSPA